MKIFGKQSLAAASAAAFAGRGSRVRRFRASTAETSGNNGL
jgi:hypothetical protein